MDILSAEKALEKPCALGFPILLGLVIGNVIGSGIYILPSALSSFGSISLASWLLTSIGALCLAWIFARMSRRFPKTGGPYIFVREAFGPFMGFVVAYTYWIGLWVTNAAIVVTAVGYLGVLFPILDDHSSYYDPLWSFGVKAGFIWLFTFINLFGIRIAGIFEWVITAVKLFPLLIITALAMFKMKWANFFPINVSGSPDGVAILNAAAIWLWAFMGLETATIPADEASDGHALYRATMYGTVIAAVFYAVCIVVLMGFLSPAELQHSPFPFSEAARLLLGDKMAWVTGICAVVAGLGALNVSILLQGQIPLAAAKDGCFPGIFAQLNARRAPACGLIISSCLITGLLFLTWQERLMAQFERIALLATFASLLTYGMTGLAELKFFLKEKPEQYKWGLTVIVLGIAYSFWMFWGVGREAVLYGLFFTLSAFPAYFFLKKKNEAH